MQTSSFSKLICYQKKNYIRNRQQKLNNMRIKSYITIILLALLLQTNAKNPSIQIDSIFSTNLGQANKDSLIEKVDISANPIAKVQISAQSTQIQRRNRTKFKMMNSSAENHAFDSLIIANKAALKDTLKWYSLPNDLAPIRIDSLILQCNPFFIDLVYENPPLDFNWKMTSDFRMLYYLEKPSSLYNNAYKPIKQVSVEQFINNIRNETRRNISSTAANLYTYTFDQLPNPDGNKNYMIHAKELTYINFTNEAENKRPNRKLKIEDPMRNPWHYTASSLVQFSQNSVSKNWHQGGTNNLAVLGILAGKLNYDDKKSIQWDNSAEWRMGFNTVSGDTLRMLSTNDDVLKLNSKLGVKAGGNWFYSGSVDFSTQLFDSYKGINSSSRKTSFLTPIRLNIGIGLDYKYKKLISVMVSPISFKYIYLNNKLLDPKLFGIKTGNYNLSEIGSSLKAIISYSPVREIQLDSKLSFYTNYQKVEIDWEMVCNFTINRFMSTRILFNPRYDNTVIEKSGDKARIQYKQLLSVGFSHKFK